ncbi:MAG: hypothetical protein ACYDDF_15130 [Thermoplasmatota archaeon]
MIQGAHDRAIAKIHQEFDALSAADAELLAVAMREGAPLHSDDRELGAAAMSKGVIVFDVVDTFGLLSELGELDDEA